MKLTQFGILLIVTYTVLIVMTMIRVGSTENETRMSDMNNQNIIHSDDPTRTTSNTTPILNNKDDESSSTSSLLYSKSYSVTAEDSLVHAASASSSSSSSKTITRKQQPQQHEEQMSAADSMNKVFGIGLKKTGTTTLEQIFIRLSVNKSLVAPPYGKMMNRNDTSRVPDFMKRYQYYQDVPWFLPEIYKKMATEYPTSKFVLTTRDPNQWWNSVLQFVYCKRRRSKNQLTGEMKLEWYRQLFDAETTSKQDMIEAFQKHNANVREFFTNESHRLLEIDLTATTFATNESIKMWTRLCEFLGVSLDECPLNQSIPHSNKSPTDTCQFNFTMS